MKRSVLLVFTLVLSGSAAAHGQTSTTGMKAAKPGHYFLVLGDSASTGFHYAGFSVYNGGWKCEIKSQISSGRMGWTCLLRSYMRKLVPSVQLENLALNGEDTCSFIAIALCHGSTGSRTGFPSYDFNKTSQLDFALKFLHDHPGQVNPIFFLLGGNDFASSDSQSVILARMVANNDSILRQLRQVAPKADIILPSYPNPTPADLKKGGSFYTREAILAGEAQKYHAFTVDLARPTEYWSYSFTDSGSGHPSDLGQKQEAELLWANYQDFMHGRQPIPINVKPSGSHVPPGKIATFIYSTAPLARLTLKLSYSGGHRSWKAQASRSGRWKASWSTAGHKGKVGVIACASKGGSNYCVDEYFVVGSL